MVYLIMQHLPLLQEYLSSWQQGTLRSSPVTKLIPTFQEQLGASPALQAARGGTWRVSHCHTVPTSRGQVQGSARRNPFTPCTDPAAAMGYEQCPGHSPAWVWVHIGASQVLAHIWAQDEHWQGKLGQLSPKNNAGDKSLAFIKSPVQNKRAEETA